jgi:hypothetical protein
MTTWDGSLRVDGNPIERFAPINFWHLEKSLARVGDDGLAWQSVTTGNFAGAEIVVADATAGVLSLDTPHVKTSIPLADIGGDDRVFAAGGLGRAIRVFRLPDVNDVRSCEFERVVDVAPQGDSPIYVRVTLENGHQAWSSPIYLFRED